jgi:hypothetical protein
MAQSQARRQKKLAKQKAKRSAKRHETQRERSQSIPQRITAPGSEVIDCLLNRNDLKENGIANAVCAVRLKTGEFGIVAFLIDTWCLGVKDVYGRILPAEQYADWMDGYREGTSARSIAPASLRKLIDDAVAFADSCGLSPHPAYARYRSLLQRFDPADAKERFEMGHNGKPHFFAGPDDDAMRCQHVVSRLQEVCGEGNFDFTAPMENGIESLFEEFGDEESEEWFSVDDQSALNEDPEEAEPRSSHW